MSRQPASKNPYTALPSGQLDKVRGALPRVLNERAQYALAEPSRIEHK